MNFSLISRSVIVHYIFNIGIGALLVKNGFEMNYSLFTILLLASLFAVSLWAGRTVERFEKTHGILIGLFSGILVFFYISFFTPVNLIVASLFIAFWMVVGLAGTFVGSKLNFTKNREKKRMKMKRKKELQSV